MKKLVASFDKFLNNISFLNRTRLILFVLAFGMACICFLTSVSLFALKYDHETLYENRIANVQKIEEVNRLYLDGAYLALQEKDGAKLSQIYDKSDDIWRGVKSAEVKKPDFPANFANWWLGLFMIYDKAPIIENSIDIESKIDTAIANLKTNAATKTAHDTLDDLYELSSLLSQLIDFHLKQAKVEKMQTDRAFTKSIILLLLLITFVFIASSYATYSILKNIRELHNYLEFDVKKKTKELEDLNNSLEVRIKEEVELNRSKDRILFQQSKLASLGEMLQNIAHQWRQPLGAISMIIQSFEIKYKAGKLDDQFIVSRVQDAKVLAQNMSDTLDDFRTFFNPNKSKKNFSLKEAINKSIDLSKYLIEKARINLTVGEFEDIYIYGFKNELIHVLLNFIGNAKDALVDKPINRKIAIIVEFDKIYTIIKVIDNGGGIDNDIIYRVFDPYFTTKHKSLGTGIGLYMSKQIVEEHMQGSIECENIEYDFGGREKFACALFTVKIPSLKDKNE
ncbi:MAG: HAMP domain-containing histidine kinase [Campylobacteraceae bacterium]|jgi:C4-dicarboxylate-specific signal transduction histidine kinase|nr:HAMP domain-containing histidine kinase [Campylobacteraceae bacterium]